MLQLITYNYYNINLDMSGKNKKTQVKANQSEQVLQMPKVAKPHFLQVLLNNFWDTYSKETSTRIKLIDIFIFYLTTLIIWQMFYRVIAGTDFPKNAFLAGIFAPIGVIVLTVSLRMHIGKEQDKPNKIPYYRAFWEYFAALIVFFVVIVNFLG